MLEDVAEKKRSQIDSVGHFIYSLLIIAADIGA
jgi:hypothetical protein